jgi:WD40 repeat protein
VGTETPGSDRLAARMRAGIAGAVRAGGRLAELRPPALAAFLAAAAFAPFLVPGAGELTVLLNQLGGLGSGYLAALLTSAAERGQPEDLAEAIAAGLEAAGEPGAALRAEVSAALRQVGAVEAAMAADPQTAQGLAELGGQLTEFGWMLGDATERLSQLVRQGARHGSDLQAARAELGALTALLQRLVQARDHGHEPRPAGEARCPYPGMRPFESKDAARFFGREDLTAHLVARLAEQVSVAAPLLVFGPSGAGKSSLLRAGLIPALRHGRLLPVAGSAKWPRILVDRPGGDPLAALATAMGGPVTDGDPAVVAAGLGRPGRFVLVVDQFEEIFTQCADSEARARFVRVLLALAARGLVVLGVRADFYQDCAGLAEFGGLLADNQVVVGPLAEGDLRRAITLPAIGAGYAVEPGLTELMVADLGLRPGATGYEPGALPLLGYALQATWDRRAGGMLTVAGYREAGGIHGAVAAEAERIYADLSAGSRDVARRILLRMVSIGPDGQLTRRAITRADLLTGLDAAGPGEVAGTVLDRFTRARLVTADTGGAEITHEAFLTAWPRLAAWIAEDRAGLRLHRQLGEDARSWDRESRDPGGLYRGARLSGAAAWRAGNEGELAGLERAFLDAGIAAEQAVRHRERRQNRRLRVLAAGLAVVLVVALAAGGIAVGQQRQAVRQRNLTQSTLLATQSDDALPVNLRTADLDALAAWQADPTQAARSSLLSRQADPYLGSFPELFTDWTTATAISPDHKLLAVAEQLASPRPGLQASIQLWDLATHRQVAVFPHQGGRVGTLAFSPDGQTLAAVVDTTAGNLRFWDVASRRRLPDPFPEKDTISTISYSPHGQRLAIGLALRSGTTTAAAVPSVIDVWDTATHRRRRRITGLTGYIWTLSFSPNARLLASGTQDGRALLWNTVSGASRGVLSRGRGPVESVLFSPDSQHVAISAKGGGVVVRTLYPAAALVPFPALSGYSAPIAFGPQGKYLYAPTGSGDALGTYDVAAQARLTPDYEMPAPFAYLTSSGDTLVGGGNGAPFALDLGQRTLRQPGTATMDAVAATPRGRLVATGSADGTVQLWHPGDPADPRQLISERSPVTGLAFSRDGRLLAAIYQNCDVRVWRPGTSTPPVVRHPPGSPARAPASLAGVAFVPGRHAIITDCSAVTTAGTVNTILIRDTATWQVRAQLRLPGAANLAGDLAVSPDGETAAVDTGTGTVLLLDTGSYRVIRRIRTRAGDNPLALAFSPDSQLLATASTGDATGTIRLWHAATGTLDTVIGPGPSQVRDLAFSPDGTTLATASQDATVRLWNVATRQLTAGLTPLPAALGAQSRPTSVSQVAFLPGNQLITALDNGTATVWDLSPAHEIRRLCEALDPVQVTTWWRALTPTPGPEPCTVTAAPAVAGRQ